MGMSKNGNRPANSTYHFRCATGFAQRTMSPNNGTSTSKKKILATFYGIINRLMTVLNDPIEHIYLSKSLQKRILFSTGILMPYQLLFQCIDKGEVPQGKHLALFWIRTRLWLIVWDVNLALHIHADFTANIINH